MCDCGKQKEIARRSITSGRTKSCGCLGYADPKKIRTHGHTRKALPGRTTPEYRTWKGIKDRCHGAGSNSRARYGKIGIKMCLEWRNDFAKFFAYVGKKPSPLHTIDRIKSTGDYAPGNVRWATQKEQSNNRSGNRLYVVDGKKQTLMTLVRARNLNYATVWSRLKNGYSIKKALHATSFLNNSSAYEIYYDRRYGTDRARRRRKKKVS